MPSHSHRPTENETTTSTTQATTSPNPKLNSNADVAQDVVLYMTLNNTTHKQDELPETLSALKQAEEEGLGHTELLPISDPYWSKDGQGSLSYHDETYAGVFGAEAADRVDWWHGDDKLKEGQVRVDGEILSLGAKDIAADDLAAQKTAKSSWRKTLMELGMPEETAQDLVESLMTDKDGSFRNLDSGAGATNEMVQFAMAMYRAESGDINVTSLVLSGHHWREENVPGEGQGIWGEVAGGDHEYDDTSDYFSLNDMARMKEVFPTAFGQVKSVQLAACNTDDLGMTNENGDVMSTNEFLQSVFPNVEMTSYWKEILAPLAASGAETNGEFVLDAQRLEHGDSGAAKDARHNEKGLKRSLLNDEGVLEEIRMKTNKKSYQGDAKGLGGGARKSGLRGKNTDYTDREDLSGWLQSLDSLPDQTPKTPVKI
jgi:hypothetical protein